MAHSMRDDPDAGGFNFDNVRRNDMLRGTTPPLKTIPLIVVPVFIAFLK